jgi:hypothetical protein
MEQRIEIFYSGAYGDGNTFDQAKKKSDELAEHGWYIHDTCLGGWDFDTADQKQFKIMVTYRRKG